MPGSLCYPSDSKKPRLPPMMERPVIARSRLVAYAGGCNQRVDGDGVWRRSAKQSGGYAKHVLDDQHWQRIVGSGFVLTHRHDRDARAAERMARVGTHAEIGHGEYQYDEEYAQDDFRIGV